MSNCVFQENDRIAFNTLTKVKYAFTNPRMVLENNGSLLIRNVLPEDEAMYVCKTVYLTSPHKIVATNAAVLEVYTNAEDEFKKTTSFEHLEKRQEISSNLLNHEFIEMSPYPSKHLRFLSQALERTTTSTNNILIFEIINTNTKETPDAISGHKKVITTTKSNIKSRNTAKETWLVIFSILLLIFVTIIIIILTLLFVEMYQEKKSRRRVKLNATYNMLRK